MKRILLLSAFFLVSSIFSPAIVNADPPPGSNPFCLPKKQFTWKELEKFVKEHPVRVPAGKKLTKPELAVQLGQDALGLINPPELGVAINLGVALPDELGVVLPTKWGGAGAFGKANTVLTHVGGALALVQYGLDLASGNEMAHLNFAKNSTYYYIGASASVAKKLKYAAIGMSVIDYSLNKFGQAAISGRKDFWYQAYKEYYDKKYKRVEDWERLFEKYENNPKEALKKGLSDYWDDPYMNSTDKFKSFVTGKGLPTPKEQEEIRIQYLQVVLPMLKNHFETKFERVKEDALARIQIWYEGIRQSRERDITYTGIVKNTGGKPLKNAEVRLLNLQPETTDLSGRYQISMRVCDLLYELWKYDQAPTITASFTPPGTKDKASESKPLTMDNTYTPNEVDFTLKLKIKADIRVRLNKKIDGAVTNEPISLAEIKLLSGTGKTFAIEPSGDLYAVDDVPVGRYELTAKKAGFETENGGPVLRKTIEVPMDHDPTKTIEHTYYLVPMKGTITITVLDAKTRERISDAKLKLFPPQSRYPGEQAVESNGKKIFRDLLAGKYSIHANADHYRSPVLINDELLEPGVPTLAARELTIEMMALLSTVKITVEDNQGTPLSGALVTLDTEQLRTDSNGIAEFNDVRPSIDGDYALKAELAGYGPKLDKISVLPKDNPGRFSKVLKLTPGGQISVSVVDDETSSPIDGASVTLTHSGPTLSESTDASGTAQFVDLAPGGYTVNATMPGYMPPATKPEVLLDGQRLQGAVTVSLAHGMQVKVRVFDEKDELIAGAHAIMDGGPEMFAPTGTYRFDRVKEGKHTFAGKARGYLEASVDYDARPKTTPADLLDIKLAPGMTIVVEAREWDQTLIADATIKLLKDGKVVETATGKAPLFSNLAEGTYTAEVVAPGFLNESSPPVVMSVSSGQLHKTISMKMQAVDVFAITNIKVMAVDGKTPPRPGAPMLVTADILVKEYDGPVGLDWKRASDGEGHVEVVNVSPDVTIPAKFQFSAPPPGKPLGKDSITLIVSDGGDISVKKTVQFDWLTGDTFKGLFAKKTQSATVPLTSKWDIGVGSGTLRQLTYTVNGQVVFQQNITVKEGKRLEHNLSLDLSAVSSPDGKFKIHVELLDPTANTMVSGDKNLSRKDEIVSASSSKGPGAGAVKVFQQGEQVFVNVEVQAAAGLSGRRTMVLTWRGKEQQRKTVALQSGEKRTITFALTTTGIQIPQDQPAKSFSMLAKLLNEAGDKQDQKHVRFKIQPAAAGGPGGTSLQNVYCASPNIIMKVWDHGAQDGDIISLRLGKDVVLRGFNLNTCGGGEPSGGPCVGNRTLANGRIAVSIYAHNEGDSPPNTAALKVQGGCTPELQHWTLSTGQTANIWVIYGPPPAGAGGP